MSQVDRYLDVAALGAVVRFEFSNDISASFESDVRRVWASAAMSDVTPDRTISISDVSDETRRLESLSVQTTLQALEYQRGKLIMFHAAGVAMEDGRVVAFVGPSGRGKTTLSRALGKHFGYVSDETIAVDAELAVYPYRKPLSVVRERAPKQQLSPTETGLLELPAAELRLDRLVLIERDESLLAPVIEAMPFVSAIELLVPQLSYLPDMSRPLQSLAALANSVGGVLLLKYAEATGVSAMLEPLLERPAVPVHWRPCLDAADGPYRPGVVADAIAVDGRVIVLGDARIHVLDGIAPSIWHAALHGEDLRGIADRVVAEHDEPPTGGARAMVEAALQELLDARILIHHISA